MLGRYVLIAQQFLDDDVHVDLANRFLDVARRERILRRHAKAAVQSLDQVNPLRRIRFHSPLSVKGADAQTYAEANRMTEAGCPIALFAGKTGEHLGTPIDLVIRRLGKLGMVVGAGGVLRLYREYVDGRDLRESGDRRVASLPKYLVRIAMIRHDLVQKIREIALADLIERFTVLVRAKSLRRALRASAARYPNDVPVGVRAGQLVVGGSAVRSRFVNGEGLSFLPRKTLTRVARSAETGLVLSVLNHGWMHQNGQNQAEYHPFGDENVRRDHEPASDEPAAGAAEEFD